jgi:hypothetical protein
LDIQINKGPKEILKTDADKFVSFELPMSNIQQWISSKNKYVLMFDGATKGILQSMGERGMIYYLGGEELCKYAWSVGIKTNDVAKNLQF